MGGIGDSQRSSGVGGVDFLETEQDTGLKWVDGKSIYQKTIDIGSLPNSSTKSVAHGVDGIDLSSIKVVSSGSGASQSDIDTIPLPYVHATSSSSIRLVFDTTNIDVVTTYNWSAYSGHITIQYTKDEGGGVVTSSINSGGAYITDGQHSATQKSTSGSGGGATFTVTVNGGTVVSIDSVDTPGSGYQVGDTITLDIDAFPLLDAIIDIDSVA